MFFFFFFFNDTATTEIYTLSLHDALPILLILPSAPGVSGCNPSLQIPANRWAGFGAQCPVQLKRHHRDRKSTRLNSSHSQISYAVFCLKKKKKKPIKLSRQAK